MDATKAFLAGCSVEQRDMVVGWDRWGSVSVPEGGVGARESFDCPCCVVDVALGERFEWDLTEERRAASAEYEDSCGRIGIPETVRLVKGIAARLNGTNPSTIAALLSDTGNRAVVGGGR